MSANKNFTPHSPNGQFPRSVVSEYYDKITDLIKALQALKADFDEPDETWPDRMIDHLSDTEGLAAEFSQFTRSNGDEIIRIITGQRPYILWLELMAHTGDQPEFVRRELNWLINQAPAEARRLLNLLEEGQR